MPQNDATVAVPSLLRPERNWASLFWKTTGWLLILGPIVYYVRRDALHYLFSYTPASFKAFWSERIHIRTHVFCAVTMIFIGPWQFWSGFRMRYLTLHTWLGRVFLVAGTFVCCSALYMGLHPRLGSIVYGFGLFLNGLFWLAAAAVAYYAISLGNIQAHKEWMIRLYVLSWAGIVGDRIIPDMTFVSRRISVDALNDISGWANWTVPLMVTEVVLQLRRLRRIRRPQKRSST